MERSTYPLSGVVGPPSRARAFPGSERLTTGPSRVNSARRATAQDGAKCPIFSDIGVLRRFLRRQPAESNPDKYCVSRVSSVSIVSFSCARLVSEGGNGGDQVMRIEIREGEKPLVDVAGAEPSNLRPLSAAAVARPPQAVRSSDRLDRWQKRLIVASKGAEVTNFFSGNKATRYFRISKSFPKLEKQSHLASRGTSASRSSDTAGADQRAEPEGAYGNRDSVANSWSTTALDCGMLPLPEDRGDSELKGERAGSRGVSCRRLSVESRVALPAGIG